MKKNFLLVILIFFNIALKGQMILEYNTNLAEGTTINLPLQGNVDVVVNWGDGSSNTYNTWGNKIHTYSTEGIYTVTINGTLTAFGSVSSSNKDKLVRVIDFGNIGLTDLTSAFQNCINLTQVPDYLPSTISITTAMFSNCHNFNQDISTWDVSNITEMGYMFSWCTSFNQNIGNWNVSNVTNMECMFLHCENFNQDLSSWDVSNVTNMRSLFNDCLIFNQDLSSWDVSNVTNLSGIFSNCKAFNQNVNTWNVSNVTDMSDTFFGCENFNQDLNNWDVSNVTNMQSMFNYCNIFNGNISDWEVSNVTNMLYMFNSCYEFNVDISNWDVSNVIEMYFMFRYASSFNQNIENWNVSKVTNMLCLFEGCTNFNQDIGKWNVANVNNMKYMLKNCTSFNQNLGNWNIANVTTMEEIFTGVPFSDENYDALLLGWATQIVKPNLGFNVGTSKYSCIYGLEARNILTSEPNNWNILDGGISSLPSINSDNVIQNCQNVLIDNHFNDCSSEITNKGVVLHTIPNPTIENNLEILNEGGGNESFTCNFSNLNENTIYYLRAFATNIYGTNYGNQIIFSTYDTLPPIPNYNQLEDLFAECLINIVNYPSATDNCNGQIIGVPNQTEFTESGTLTWTYSDIAGNFVTQTQNIIIEDETNPNIECVTNQTIYLNENQTYYTIQGTEFDPTGVIDNCVVANIYNNFNNLTTLENAQLPTGTTTIVWTVTDNFGNIANCSFDVTVNAFVNISAIATKGISIYPNPAFGIVNIEFANNNIQKLTVFDVTGKQISEKTDIQKNETIDLSSFESGIYIISIQTDKEIFTTKVILH